MGYATYLGCQAKPVPYQGMGYIKYKERRIIPLVTSFEEDIRDTLLSAQRGAALETVRSLLEVEAQSLEDRYSSRERSEDICCYSTGRKDHSSDEKVNRKPFEPSVEKLR